MDAPEPNAPPVSIQELTVEQRVCECCKKKGQPSKPRFFVRKDGDVVLMAYTWEAVCDAKGWK